jgi:hypothetical protein
MAVDVINGVNGFIVDIVGTKTHYVPEVAISVAADLAAFEAAKAAQASVAGFADIDLGVARAAGDDPVLADGPYKLGVSIDGGAFVDIDITASTTTTYTALIALLDAALTGATASIAGGNLRITSDDLTDASKVVIREGQTIGLLAALTHFEELLVPVDGNVLTALAAVSRIGVPLSVMYADAIEVFDSVGVKELLAGADLPVAVGSYNATEQQNLIDMVNALKAKVS